MTSSPRPGRSPLARGFLLVSGALLGALLVAGCMPKPATTQGREIDGLYAVFLAGGIVVALLVWGLATFAVLRYRHARFDRELPRQVRGSVRIEAVWTAIPIIVVLALFVLTLQTLAAVGTRSPAPGIDLRITAFRWGWSFEYVGRGITLTSVPGVPPEVVVPVGQPVHVTLASADVNHALFVPAFLFKRDAIPGHETTFDFEVAAAGFYPGTCAEFCGVYHAQMPFGIRGVPQADFDAWVASGGAGGSAPMGTYPPGWPGPSPKASAPAGPSASSPSPSASTQVTP